jgi:hypothetical protein
VKKGIAELVSEKRPDRTCVVVGSHVGNVDLNRRFGRAVGRFRRGRSVILLQQATEALSTGETAVAVRLHRERRDQFVAHALMVAYMMIMLREL